MTRRELLTVAEAAARLGVSETEIRRRIKAGTLPAEQFERPQGTYFRVIFEVPDDTPEDTPTTSQGALDTRQELPTTYPDLPAAITAATVPLKERLAAADVVIGKKDETISQQASDIADLREKVGRAEAAANYATSRAAELQAECDAARAELEALRSAPWWRRLFG